jgi:hypothetical protein
MTKEIEIRGVKFELNKSELVDLEDQCEDALLELRLTEISNKVKKFGQSKTLMDYFSK